SNIGALLRIIKAATPPGYRFNKKPGQWASNTFRAIRMEVNNELGVIHSVLPQAIEALKPNGRIAVLTFQSLEDRIVKSFFKDLSLEKSISPISRETIPPALRLITRKPLTPSEDEIKMNPRSNCSKLRVAEKI
ncbi:MAG: 16S rRNA (cytosine(1402)-N(4))-methyltransferase, partial [bacterium]